MPLKKRIGKGSIYRRGETYWLKYTHPRTGKVVRQSLETTDLSEAKKAQERIMGPILLGEEAEVLATRLELEKTKGKLATAAAAARAKLSLDDTWQTYLDSDLRPDTGPATLRQYGFQWLAFADWLKKHHPEAVHLAEVTPALAQEYAAYLRTQALSAGTVNKHLGLLKLVYKTLGEGEGITENPFGKLRRKQEVQQHRRELPWDKLCKICDAAEGELKTLMFLGIYTGQRLGDCCTLTWDSVDLMRRIIIIVQRKNARRKGGEPVHIPIHRHLLPLLEATPPDQRKGHVLPALADTYLRRGSEVTDQIQRLIVKCEIDPYEPKTGPGTGKRAVLRYGFHSLRHSTATLLQEAGAPAAVAERILGHSSTAMRQRYTHIGLPALQQAVDRLPGITAEKDKLLPPSDADAKLAQIRAIVQQATGELTEREKQIAAILGLTKAEPVAK